uniref:Uncharacterized protein n=1 Tax=Oryza meridionalis TaxID=40149 RepID=A0A0E0BX30_9ORYZ
MTAAAAAAGGRGDLSAAVSDEANAWCVRFKNGAVDDGDDDDDVGEEEEEGAAATGGGGETEKDSCVETEKDSCVEKEDHLHLHFVFTSAMIISSRNREEVSGDDYVQAGGGLERRKRKATVTPQKVQTSKVGIKNKKVQAQYLSDLAKEAEWLSQENENLRWELKFKTKDLEHAVQTVEWKNKEIEVLKKENNELKTENENYKKNDDQSDEYMTQFSFATCQPKNMHTYYVLEKKMVMVMAILRCFLPVKLSRVN